MKGVERTNAVVVRGQSLGATPRKDPYTMEVNRGRNYYACEGFGHMACHCRNQGRGRVVEKRRLEYAGEGIKENLYHSDNLKGVENLEFLD